MSPAETTIDERIGARIRGLQAGRGLTLEGWASLAEVSRAMLSRIERSGSSPTAQLLATVCTDLILGGTLDLGLGAETFRLETGDCLRMEFDRPIRFHNPTSRPIRYPVIVSHGAMKP